jgi:uncharacterized membrane protein (UPF0136 family)
MEWLQACQAVYGILNIVLGVIGALNGSWISLAAGGGAGLIALVGAWMAKTQPTVGFVLGGIACVAILGGMVPRLIKNFNVYPGGVTVAASVVMLALLAVGHFGAKR